MQSGRFKLVKKSYETYSHQSDLIGYEVNKAKIGMAKALSRLAENSLDLKNRQMAQAYLAESGKQLEELQQIFADETDPGTNRKVTKIRQSNTELRNKIAGEK